jgi:hypothetical protein
MCRKWAATLGVAFAFAAVPAYGVTSKPGPKPAPCGAKRPGVPSNPAPPTKPTTKP